MKNIFPIHKLILFFAPVAIIIACNKTETITVQQPIACFSNLVIDPYGNSQLLGSTNYIDSNFYFQNCSDAGTKITYHWNFGDGATSTDKNPKHAYARRGNYFVTLIVSNENRAYDSIRQTVSVISGQQHISFGDGTNASPIAIEETATNEFILLGSSGYGLTFNLFQLDSLLKQKSMKTFPANYQLTSMKSATDDNYIFTGSTQTTNKANELIKMSADGTLLWNKILSTDDYYTYASTTPDGGYCVIGSRSTPGPYGNTINYTVVIKTDNNGNQQWQKLLDQESMIQTKDAVIENDGITIAGVKRNVTGTCSDCDSLLIVKLNNAGNKIWQNTVLWGLNNSNWWNTCITKLKNGNYSVSNEYTSGIFFFSPSGSFLDRKLMPYQVSSVVNSDDGNLIVLQSEIPYDRIGISKMTLDGLRQWYAYPDGRQIISVNSYSCCSRSWPVAIRPLHNGGIVVTGYRVNNNSIGNGIHTVILLLALDDTGKPK